jgi:hypothetical protein
LIIWPVFLASQMSQPTFTVRELFDNDWASALPVFGLITFFGLGGTAFGIAGWIQIGLSKGRLRGLWLAVTSTLLLPPMSLLVLLLFLVAG